MMVIKKVSKVALGAVLFGGAALLPANAAANKSCLSQFELTAGAQKIEYQTVNCAPTKAVATGLKCTTQHGSCEVQQIAKATPFPNIQIEIAKNVKEVTANGATTAKAVYYIKGPNFANINIENLQLDVMNNVKLVFPVLIAGMMESTDIPKGVDASKIVVGSANGVLQVITPEGSAFELRPMGASYVIYYNEKQDKATVFGNINWQDYMTIKVKTYLKNIHALLQEVQTGQLPKNLNQINLSTQLQSKIFQIVPEKLVFTVTLDSEFLNNIKGSPQYKKWLEEWQQRAKSNDIIGELAKGVVQILKGEKDSITITFVNKTNANLAQLLSMVLSAALTPKVDIMKALLESQFEIHVFVR